MREITEKHIIEMIKNQDKYKGAGKTIRKDWKGASQSQWKPKAR